MKTSALIFASIALVSSFCLAQQKPEVPQPPPQLPGTTPPLQPSIPPPQQPGSPPQLPGTTPPMLPQTPPQPPAPDWTNSLALTNQPPHISRAIDNRVQPADSPSPPNHPPQLTKPTWGGDDNDQPVFTSPTNSPVISKRPARNLPAITNSPATNLPPIKTNVSRLQPPTGLRVMR